jgi:hypothetical protein
VLLVCGGLKTVVFHNVTRKEKKEGSERGAMEEKRERRKVKRGRRDVFHLGPIQEGTERTEV